VVNSDSASVTILGLSIESPCKGITKIAPAI